MDTITPDLVDGERSGRTTNRMSARSGCVEILSGVERRRSWTLEQKREIVSESLGPELTPTEVARKHGISTGQIYTWRRQLLNGRRTALLQTPRFAPVELTPSAASMSPAPPAPTPAPGSIEIVLPGGVSVRVNADVDSRALRRVLGALSQR
jgi:transposase